MIRFIVFAAFTCLWVTLRVQGESNIFCFTCTDIANPSDCHNLTDCGPNVTKCRTDSAKSAAGNFTFTLGCDVNQTCPIPTTTIVTPTHANHTNAAATTANPNVTGSSNASASSQPGRRDVTQALSDSCNQCCSGDNCNLYLCHELVANKGVCEDDPTCDGVFNIIPNFCAANLATAKKICKKKCDLCDLVDGIWSDWQKWSDCSNTCGNGTHNRKRLCDNPPPEGAGLNCTGDGQEIDNCYERDCPVDGNWSDWSEWSECSVTCSLGLQRRDRNCSDPAPDADGEYCSGDSRDDRICEMSACHDGEWGPWNPWAGCTDTCWNEFQTRERDCMVNNQTVLGHICDGEGIEMDLCKCPEPAFDVTGVVHQTNVGTDSIAMSVEVTNIGDSYDLATGTFTCKVPGLYNFYLSIDKQFGVSKAFCQLTVSDESKMTVLAQSPSSGSLPYVRSSNSVLIELAKGTIVYLGNCSEPDTFTPFSTFSGFLVKPL